MQKLQFNLTIDETKLILEALGEMPFVRVHQLIAKMQQQAETQSQTTQDTNSADNVLFSGIDTATFGSSVISSNLIVNGETNLKGKLSVTDNATFTAKVGIGTKEPTEKLEVNGKIKASEIEAFKVKATAISTHQSGGKF